jgi:hypothetical protein
MLFCKYVPLDLVGSYSLPIRQARMKARSRGSNDKALYKCRSMPAACASCAKEQNAAVVLGSGPVLGAPPTKSWAYNMVMFAPMAHLRKAFRADVPLKIASTGTYQPAKPPLLAARPGLPMVDGGLASACSRTDALGQSVTLTNTPQRVQRV